MSSVEEILRLTAAYLAKIPAEKGNASKPPAVQDPYKLSKGEPSAVESNVADAADAPDVPDAVGSGCTIVLGKVENSQTRLPVLSGAEMSERLRNMGKARYHANTWGEDDTGRPFSGAELDAAAPCLTTLRAVAEAPAGSHYFFKVYPNPNDQPLRAAWQIEKCDNAFVKAAVMAFAEHLPFRIKPDHAFELMIAGFNVWLNEFGGAAALQAAGLVGERQRVQVDFYTSDWDNAIDALGAKLCESIANAELRAILLARFSTTTAEMRRAHTLTIASAYRKFVDIHFNTMCGIPSVTCEGSQHDWEALKLVANALNAISAGKLQRWIEPLSAALDVVLAGFGGQDTASTWCNFINHDDGSGFSGCSGWINAFLPYVRNYKQKIVPNPAVWSEGASFARMNSLGAEHWQGEKQFVPYSWFLGSFARDEYPWQDGPTKRRLLITAGLIDAIQWENDGALEPMLSFQIDLFQ